MVKKNKVVIKIIPIDPNESTSSGEVDDRTREFPLFSSSFLWGKGARGGIGGLASVRPVAVCEA